MVTGSVEYGKLLVACETILSSPATNDATKLAEQVHKSLCMWGDLARFDPAVVETLLNAAHGDNE